MNTSKAKENEQNLLNLLDEAFGGWPVLKSYAWNEKDFHWNKAMVKARNLGLYYKSLIVIGVYSKRFGDNLMLWVGNINSLNDNLKICLF